MYSLTGNVNGVFEAIDKKNTEKSKEAQKFSKKDEGLLKLIGIAANYIIHQDQGKEKGVIMLGILRELLRVSSEIMDLTNEIQVVKFAESEAIHLFNAESCRIHLIKTDEENQPEGLYRYKESFVKGVKEVEESPEIYDYNGLVGYVASSGALHYSNNFMNNPHYNRKQYLE